MEQYKAENAEREKDLPTLREIVGSTWKKEDKLKQLKSEMAALERNIQLMLTTPEQANKDSAEQQPAVATVNDDKKIAKEQVVIPRPNPPITEVYKGFKV